MDYLKASEKQVMDYLQQLLHIIERLRSPEGCLWDRSQQMDDIGRYLLDEAYEVIDAVGTGEPSALKEELGDLLFQILFMARLADEAGTFNLGDVMQGIAGKMIRRHPHVFGKLSVNSVGEIRANWEIIKTAEKLGETQGTGLLSGIPQSMPALLRAQKMGEKGSRVGFDWPDADGILSKIEEEIGELRSAIASARPDRIREEIGDLLFSVVNLARFTQVNAEEALRETLKKFSRRFSYIERRLKMQGKTFTDVTLPEMDALWEEAKKLQEG